MLPQVAPNADRELGEARAAIDRGDARAALGHLDRARRGYGKQRDREGLEHVLDMLALVDTADDRSRAGRANLVYAVKQNLRQESRRTAQERRQPWSDPYPDLQAPSEHTTLVLGRGAKLAVAVGVLLGTALLVGILTLPWLVGSSSAGRVTLRIVNDGEQPVTVRVCRDADCATARLHRRLEPGLEADAEVDSDELVTLVEVEQPGEDECLPVRVHDGYERLAGGNGALAVRLSQASACPGTTVLPEPAEETPL